MSKTVLITGSTGGIGSKIAEVLYSYGAEIYLSGTRREKLEILAKKLGKRAHILEINLSKIEMFEKEITEISGNIDCVINNAGVTRDGLLMRMKDEDIDDVLNINLAGTIKLTRFLLKNMLKNKFGRIINISSVVGFTGNPGQSNYSASKAGIIGFTKSLALEVASRGITVNAIAPGYIMTPMTEKLSEEQKNKVLSNIPAGRMGLPLDIANTVKFLLSEDANYITGNTIHVNGGLAMI